MAYNPSKIRVVKNTAFLYARTLLLLIIGIFTSRITLQALGVSGYGTVNVISGFVGMFAIVSGSLTGACQRFLTYEMEAKQYSIQQVFNASLKIHIVLAIFLFLIGETTGLYFVNYKLKIPPGDIDAVQWVYQCSVASLLLSLLNIPYNALIISYERLNIFAYISLLEGILKFIVVFLLLYIPGNKLIIYACLTLSSAIIVRFIFQIYCRLKFKNDVRILRRTDKNLINDIFGFAGWTFLGNTATICSNQGVNIVINIFCGVVVNAARGIAVMVEGVITGFITNFTTALNPQITKSYASNDIIQVIELIQLGLRMVYYLMLIISIPVILAANELLDIWFVEVPEYTTSFVRLTLVIAMIQALGNPFLTLLLASGRIRNYQIIAGAVTIINLPLSYLLLYLNYSPVIVYLINILLSLLTFIIRMFFLEKSTKIRTFRYFDTIWIRMVLCGIICIISSIFYYRIFDSINNIFKLALFGIGSGIISLIIMFFVGINTSDRSKIKVHILSKLGYHDR